MSWRLDTHGRLTFLVLASDTPGWFILRGDLEDLVRLGRGEPFEDDGMSWPRTLARFRTMPQIVVAAVNGQAGGGGFEMTLACTLRVVGPRARFTRVEVALGLIPGGGGTQRLPRLIGSVRLEIAERYVADEPFLHGVLGWLAPIADRPPTALTAAKRAVLDGLELPLENGLALEASLVGPPPADPASLARQERAIARYRETPPVEFVATGLARRSERSERSL